MRPPLSGLRILNSALATSLNEIDSEEKAWVLGLLAADGHISRNKCDVTLKLKSSDRSVLELVRGVLQVPSEIRAGTYRRQTGVGGCCVLWCGGKSLVLALARHGLTHDKTATGTPWHGPPELMRHYWRGCLDGDGSIVLPTDHFRSGRVTFVGNRAMVDGFAAYVSTTFGGAGTVRPHSSIFRCHISNRAAVVRLCESLYGDCRVAMPRKLERATSLVRLAASHI